MLLVLEITSAAGDVTRHTFREEGGSIGRDLDNSLVLPHAKVSGLHALITCRNNAYYVEDRSRNGVCINSRKNRIPRDRPTALKAGDRILIDPYDLRVSLARDRGSKAPRGFDSTNPFDTDDPFAEDPLSDHSARSGDPETGELDPIKLLKLSGKSEPSRTGPTARDLQEASLLEEHYKPPAVLYEPPLTPPATIPEDYDPLADVGFQETPKPHASRDWPRREPVEPSALRVESLERPAATPIVERPAPPVQDRPVPPASDRAMVALVAEVPAPRVPDTTDESGPPVATIDLGAVFAGAGLDPSLVTPAVARDFGAILRIVVSGVMDVMRSRQEIKDEFRMAGTRVRPIDNNPLKFSADVDDALHNLLVKRNRAYLTPVEAFADAFDDLRRHQMAMLAGVRAAFEATLEEFDPDHLQQEFDRQAGKGLVPAKLRYWDLYRDAHHALTKDPETTFRRLFGEHFARAYEEQLKVLKAGDSRSGSAPVTAPMRPDGG